MLTVIVIGAGFSGLSAAAYSAAAGHEVHVFEKNAAAGGRARQLKTDSGYTFDMGPSWYWMPDIFESFFNDFNTSTNDFYDLTQLDPAFEMIFDNQEVFSVPANIDNLCNLFESTEKGGAAALKKFLEDAEKKYQISMERMAKMPGLSLTEFIDKDVLKNIFHLQLFSSFSKHVRNYFSDKKLIAMMEFPVLFLGAMPQKTPALYSLMNYAALKLGTWYPQGGFGSVVEAVKKVAENEGTKIHLNAEVEKISVGNGEVRSITVNNEEIKCDAVIASADYNHVEKGLLPTSFQNYSSNYWENKTFAPSCLIYYLGISRKIKGLEHHNLFFEEDLFQHSKDIYKNPKWPEKPLFYASCPTKTDATVAPKGHETLFLLLPVAPGLKDDENIREEYFDIMLKRLEKHVGQNVRPQINYKKSYCINDFKSDYHAYKGNAYGLANTLKQTAIMKPKIKNKKLDNLFYTGQLTVPGPGVPPALISGKIAAGQLNKQLDKHYEVAI